VWMLVDSCFTVLFYVLFTKKDHTFPWLQWEYRCGHSASRAAGAAMFAFPRWKRGNDQNVEIGNEVEVNYSAR